MAIIENYNLLLKWISNNAYELTQEEKLEVEEKLGRILDKSDIRHRLWLESVIQAKMAGISYLINKADEIDSRILDAATIKSAPLKDLIQIATLLHKRIEQDILLVKESEDISTTVDARSVHLHFSQPELDEAKGIVNTLNKYDREKLRKRAEKLLEMLKKDDQEN